MPTDPHIFAPNFNDDVGLLEITHHEFLDKARRKERITFADGTTVTVDWDAKTVSINPACRFSLKQWDRAVGQIVSIFDSAPS